MEEGKKKRSFDPAFHHPIVELARHVASPLSAGLAIIALQKRWQFPLIRDVVWARWNLFRNKFHSRPRQPPSGGGGTNKTSASKPTPPVFCKTKENLIRPPTDSVKPGSTSNFLALSTAFEALGPMFSPRLSPEERSNQLLDLYNPEVIPEVMSHLVDFPTVHLVENILHRMHDGLQLPWWATIALYTFFLRMTLVPMFVHVLRNSSRIKLTMGEVVDMKNKSHEEPTLAATTTTTDVAAIEAKQAKDVELSKGLLDILAKHRCNPLSDLYLPVLLPPVILSSYFAIHNILLYEPACATEGVLWMHDLSSVDSTFLLPVLCNASWLLLMELSAGVYYHWWDGIKNMTRFVAVTTVPLAFGMPTGVLLFWTTSNTIALMRVYALQQDGVRDFLRIPRVSTLQKLPWLPQIEPASKQSDKEFFDQEWSRPLFKATTTSSQEQTK